MIFCVLCPARVISLLMFIVLLGICDEFVMKSFCMDVWVLGMTSAE